MRFFDASALVKRYVREQDSNRIRRLIRSGPAAVSRLSEVEVVSAFARLTREGAITAVQRDRASAAFVADLSAWTVIELTQAVARISRRLLAQHVLRAGDAVQLASALTLQEALDEPLQALVAFDDRMLTAARAEQLTVVGPATRRRRGGA